MISSPISVIPVPIAPNQPKKSKPVVAIPITPDVMIPSNKTNMTLNPATALPKTIR